MPPTPDQIGFIVGILFCALVGAQAAISLLGARRSYVEQRRIAELRIAAMEEELSIAALRREVQPAANASWQGFRRFEVRRAFRESDSARSLHLVPQDRRPLPRYLPGQYVTIRVQVPGETTAPVRCYSLSDRARQDYFRITVKAIAGTSKKGDASAAGRVSRHINIALQEGDVVELQAPEGNFVLDLFDRRPAVLLAAGIGITPLMSMVRSVAHEESGRQVILFYGVRDGSQHVFKDELAELVESNPNIRVITCYSQPRQQDQLGDDFDFDGRIDLRLIQSVLTVSNYEFFVCGPNSFIGDLIHGLEEWGVPSHRIHQESFGGATPPNGSGLLGQEQPAASSASSDESSVTIALEASGQSIRWNEACKSILECAEQQGLFLPSGCREGKCGACMAALTSGSVKYPSAPEFELDANQCLPCQARPTRDVTLDV